MAGNPVNPSGGARSTAEDYMKFLVMLLNKGKYNGKQVLSETAVSLMMMVQNKAEQIKYAPKAAEGYLYASGSWVVESKLLPTPATKLIVDAPAVEPVENRMATALASPGLFGTWPMIDFCRGYAYIVFVKNLLGEARAEVHKELKKIIDIQIPYDCK